MADIYEQHQAAFARVSAYVIAHKGERVATIAFKFPADGAGRLYAYVHWLGTPMARGFAGGYGYDKRSAAVTNAVRNAAPVTDRESRDADLWGAFSAALWVDGGSTWDNRLLAAGFEVWQAV